MRAPQPQDASEAQHEYLAQVHEEAAARHTAQHVAAQSNGHPSCDQYLGSCWTANPTEDHLKQAQEQRRAAAGHHVAARALREAEAHACRGVPEADRDISPFFHREAIAKVEPLVRRGAGDQTVEELAGATIVLLPATGMTLDRLQRVVQCHLARNAALGHRVPEMSYCPLVPKGVAARVVSKGNGFAVDVTSEEASTAAEILRRARALLTG
jgi:hypothetical protein